MQLIYIDPVVDAKIRYMVDSCPTELSGFAKIEKKKKGVWVITDARVVKQLGNNTSATTMIEADEDNLFWDKIEEEGGDSSEWRVWWHSHANMGVHFSGPDQETMRYHAVDCFKDWFIGMCYNKKGDSIAHIVYPEPHLIRIECELKLLTNISPELEEEWKQEFQLNISGATPVPTGLSLNVSKEVGESIGQQCKGGILKPTAFAHTPR